MMFIADGNLMRDPGGAVVHILIEDNATLGWVGQIVFARNDVRIAVTINIDDIETHRRTNIWLAGNHVFRPRPDRILGRFVPGQFAGLGTRYFIAND